MYMNISRPWRRRRPPASPGVACGQGSAGGHPFLPQECIPDRNAFLPGHLPHTVDRNGRPAQSTGMASANKFEGKIFAWACRGAPPAPWTDIYRYIKYQPFVGRSFSNDLATKPVRFLLAPNKEKHLRVRFLFLFNVRFLVASYKKKRDGVKESPLNSSECITEREREREHEQERESKSKIRSKSERGEREQGRERLSERESERARESARARERACACARARARARARERPELTCQHKAV